MLNEAKFNKETNYFGKKQFLIFFLLFFYSLIPAFAKVTGSNKFYFLSPLIVVLLLLNGKKKYYKLDILFFLFFSFVLLYFPISYLFVPDFDRNSGLNGLMIYMIPMLGYFISRNLEMKSFFDIVKNIGIIHGAYAFLTYGFFKFPENFNEIILKIREGSMYYRMNSFSGSFVFSSLMLLTFIIILLEIFEKGVKSKITLVSFLFVGACLFFSFQRGAWLATVATIFFFLIMKKGKSISKYYLFFGIFILVFLIFILNTSFLKVAPHFIQQRLQVFRVQISYNSEPIERVLYSINAGINNFIRIPTGVGLGQIGQGVRFSSTVSNRYYPIPDGDFFRILSETGIFGLFFYSSFLFIFLKAVFQMHRKIAFNNDFLILVSLLFAVHIQMIFSNVTEFYFVNLIYWILVGFFFANIKDFSLKSL